ncbi:MULTISPECIES: hypothetical protein [Oceanospirillaceae]|jgi:hypothetical protein|uniref:hypothetical protein n=1 Tax=Oceanospirillaceae TaxID=135620 RepID=UPI000C43DFD4|nr:MULTISPECIES: hypothetical protein [Thalassolituus]MAY14954.1 hypothetical protein [Oceanospirillaceae bacterium]MBU2098009.1 hypothetical protein [Gammaproteobacteria bacterium]MCB2385227.1 hypothetical protein [Thalassolituus alkanivorans]MCB2421916.1 hypothetical protein [Thalassolituus alkanivorans]TVV45370.1 hypothetical protein FOT50_00610 [Thalassolituus sp. C2-1]|tara:strand:+ start:1169 stop:1876 length:708 start_codon:yes stop_codon:yes gene_type:complete
MQKRQEIQQRSRLGTLLIHKGLITRQQLDEALTLQAQSGMRLGEVLVNNGWLTERQLSKALKKQSRYRLIAAISAVLLGPIQPFMANANAATDNSAIAEQQITERSGMQMMSDSAMSDITAQGAMTNYERLLDIVNSDLDSDDAAITTLESLASSLIPGTNLLDAEMEVSGVEYEPGPRTTINADGSLEVQMPTTIKQIAFRNVRVAGSEGQHMGDVIIRDISFGAGTSVKIQLR